jgi:hypothetical protein
METLAELSGDVDERVEVLRRDRSSAYQYLRIAEAYREAAATTRPSNGRSRAWPPSLGPGMRPAQLPRIGLAER